MMKDDMSKFAETPRDLVILDENGNELLAGNEDRRYFEDSWMHKHNGKYCELIYREDGSIETIAPEYN